MLLPPTAVTLETKFSVELSKVIVGVVLFFVFYITGISIYPEWVDSTVKTCPVAHIS